MTNEFKDNHQREFQRIEGLTARQIVEFVKHTTGRTITISLKNRKRIVIKAVKILKSVRLKGYKEPVEFVTSRQRNIFMYDIGELSKSQMCKVSKDIFGSPIAICPFSFLYKRSTLIHRLVEKYQHNLYKMDEERYQVRAGTEVWLVLAAK